jgi:hypothetical protein
LARKRSATKSVKAFQILTSSGFREARSFEVEAHDHFRARARELENKEIMEVQGPTE